MSDFRAPLVQLQYENGSSVPLMSLHRRTSTSVVPLASAQDNFAASADASTSSSFIRRYSQKRDNTPQGPRWKESDSDKRHIRTHTDGLLSRRSSRLPSTRHLLRSALTVSGWLVSLTLFLVLVFTKADQRSQRSIDVGVMSLQNFTRPYLNSVAGKFASTTGLDLTLPLGSLSESVRATKSSPASSSLKSTIKTSVNPDKNRVTIISSFYRIDSGKKHRVSEYQEWLGNFLGQVELPIVFYCAPELRTLVTGLRGSKPITIIDTYETPFTMPPLEALGGREWAILQNSIDPESNWHVPDVYGVWTAKPWMVKNVKDLNIYDSEYFFWVDAGSFRDSGVTHDFIGLETELDNIYMKITKDTLVLSSTETPFEQGLEYVTAARVGGEMDRTDRLQGGWYGGKAEGVEWWAKETMKVTIRQSALQKFTAKEQPVWNQAAALNWPKIYVQNMGGRQGTDCGDNVWFAFEYFADGRDCNVPAWNGPEHAARFGTPSSTASLRASKSRTTPEIL